MAFGIDFEISSIFDGSGFRQANQAMERFENQGLDVGLSADEIRKRMQAMGDDLRMVNGQFADAEGNFMDTGEAMEMLQSETAAMGALAQRTGRDVAIMGDVLDRTSMRLEENAQGAMVFRDTLTGAMNESGTAASAASQQLQTFRFDMLSLMFAGMEASRVIKGLFKPAMDAMGVFDVWGNTLEIFFLPAAGQVLDFVLRLRDFLLSLDPETRETINSFLLWAGVIFTLLQPLTILILNLQVVGGAISKVTTFAGKAATAFSGLIKYVGKKGLWGAVKGLIPSIGKKGLVAAIKTTIKAALIPAIKIIGVVIGVIMAVIGVVKAVRFVWENDFLYMRTVIEAVGSAVGSIIGGIIDFIMDLVGALGTLTDMVAGVAKRFDDLVKGAVGVEDATSDMNDEMERTEDVAPDPQQEFGLVDIGVGNGFDPMGQSQPGGTRVIDQDNFIDVDGGQFEDGDELADGIVSRQEEMMNNTLSGR